VGFGILTCEDEAQALVRASPAMDHGGRDQGGRAVRACLALVELKRRFTEGGR
jgi:6,7-dimethyl-8-ribityllumazine synthase